MRLPLPLSLAALALHLITFTLAGAAFARETMRPARPGESGAPPSRRALPDADLDVRARRSRPPHPQHRSRTATATTARISQWTIDIWTRRASTAPASGARRVHTRLAVAIPKRAAPAQPRSCTRVAYTPAPGARACGGSIPGTVTRRFAGARGKTGAATLQLWQRRLAAADASGAPVRASGRSRPRSAPRSSASTTTRAPGTRTPATATTAGLQMDRPVPEPVRPRLRRPVGHGGQLARLGAAPGRGPRVPRRAAGFYPWPNTARACGLI